MNPNRSGLTISTFRGPTALLVAHAAVHGDTTAFAWASAIFVAGAIVAGGLFEHGTKALELEPAAAAAMAH